MDCPTCGHPNRSEARFCGECGASLLGARRCSDCGTENPAGQRFCDGCGRQLIDASSHPEAASGPRARIPDHLAAKIRAGASALKGERKQVTVLFADVVGSMALAAEVDPEAWRGIMERLFSLSCEAVHRYGGTVDRFTGDGAIAIFGAPIAHEDHARRACYAALELQRALAEYAEELREETGTELAVRIGLNSGEVIVGAIGADLEMDYTAIGHTVGIAQRAESLAEPGGILLTEHTANLVEGYLELVDRGPFEPKGVGSLRMHELVGHGRARGRLDVERGRGLSRFIGREREMEALEGARERALDGQGQVVGVVGEAGVGKSRLCHDFAERCRARGMPVYRVGGQAHLRSAPLMPVLQLLREFFGIEERDPDRVARRRIEQAVAALDPRLGEELPLLFEFLAVADRERPAERMDPEARQRRLLDLLKRLARAQSAQQPVVTVFEDLHWLDTASEAYLANHVEALQGTRSIALVNFRPDYQAQWMSRSYYRQVALSPLGAEASGRLLVELLGSDPSLDGLAELIGERAEGNPFFIEEIVQAQVDEGNLAGSRGDYRLVRPIEQISVPSRVQSVLAARIDRLPEREKAVLGAAAVIGREFSQAILEPVAALAPDELEEAVGRLVSAEFVYPAEFTPEPIYAFKHALTQQVAYDSQLQAPRRALHAKAAETIASGNPERLEERAALVAGHWEAAGERLEAAGWNARAAAWAGASDPATSLRHWRKVRELADSLAESEGTASLGLTARIFMLRYGTRLGIADKEAEAILQEGERIATDAEDIRSRALLLTTYGLTRTMSEGKLDDAVRIEREAIALAEETRDPALLLAGALGSCHTLTLAGRIDESIEVASRAIELAGGDTSVGADLAVGCPVGLCHVYRGFNLAYVGELEQGGREIARGRQIAREHGDAEVVGWSHLFSSFHSQMLGEPGTALGHAQQGLEAAERAGDWLSRSWAWLYLGRAEMMRDGWQAALEALERSREICREHRIAVEAEPFRLVTLAETHVGLGDEERAQRLASEGLAVAVSQGNILGEVGAKLARARALLAGDGPVARTEIEAVLTSALELIGRVGVKALEPQAHLELAELARRSDDQGRWREELSEAHRLFTEIGAEGHAERAAGELATTGS